MLLFDPLRDFFQRRQIVRLDALAGGVQLLNLRSESPRGSFVFPGTDCQDNIEVGSRPVGYVDYGISPLGRARGRHRGEFSYPTIRFSCLYSSQSIPSASAILRC
ncbi:hypothetical protein HDC32_003385 [Pseudomonas sp. JAI120]|nr:hypothetical protein [Pseudomonas sp. SJZ073]MBB6313687.1 hypothetical protein [Pseudomonas sp. JAI120]